MKKLFITIFVLIMAPLMVQAAQDDGSSLYSSGSAGFQNNFSEPAFQSALNLSILAYNPFLDVASRISGLGYTLTETSNPADLNRTNLQNYNVLWIGVDNDPATYASQNAEIQAWVNIDGGGLIVNQPNHVGNVPVLPIGYGVSIYDTYWQGDYGAMIVNYSHPITQGLTNDDLAGNFESVYDQDIGGSWDILAVDAETPTDISLLAGEYGKGRLVFNTNLFDLTAFDPGSDKYLTQMIDWTGSGKAGWGTAYKQLSISSSDLELFREYRDEILSKKAKGRRFKRLLYKNSKEALAVLLDNPELIVQLKALIDANKDAVQDVSLGYRGIIYNTDEIAAFLDEYAKKAPPRLRFLAKVVKRQMLRKQRQGKLFFGFRLK